jgi:oligopeptide/dipeptide ABC transporter ATP-binding protein
VTIADEQPLLSIKDLAVAFPSGRRGKTVRVVDGVSLTLRRGETLGVVGESGSGKSMTALSVLRLVPEPGRIVRGKITLDGADLLALPEKAMRSVRGGRVAMIFQDPMTSLNPVFTVGEQVAEAARVHRKLSWRDAWEEAVRALGRVHIAEPERRAHQYPHELSGGMRQRVMIALALACRPDVLLADEPTTALDVTVQAQILALLAELRRDEGMAVLLITHDLAVVAETCDNVVVMYAGQVMETAATADLFATPAHPYTQGLLASLPERAPADTVHLPYIKGQPPANAEAVPGCPFRTRCPKVMPGICERPLPTVSLANGQVVRCHLFSPPAPSGGALCAGTSVPLDRVQASAVDAEHPQQKPDTKSSGTLVPAHSAPPEGAGGENVTHRDNLP